MDTPRLNIDALLDEKTCSVCKESKPKSDFYRDGPHRLMSLCKVCVSDKNKKARRDRGLHHEWRRREVIDGKFRCVVCLEFKSPSDFHRQKNSPDGIRSQCKPCSNASTRKYRSENLEKVREKNRKSMAERRRANKDKTRSIQLKCNYGITLEQYNVLLEVQNGACAICGAAEADASGKKLHVDHDHATGRVRGLLCGNCNRGVGYFKDSVARLEKAVEYLNRQKVTE